jgi:hypothetical protein
MTLASIFTATFDFLFGVIPTRDTLRTASLEDGMIATLIIICISQVTAVFIPGTNLPPMEIALSALGGMLCIASFVYFATRILNKTTTVPFTHAEVLAMDIVTTGGMTVITAVLGYLMTVAQPLQTLALFVAFVVFSIYAFVLMLKGISTIAGITKWNAFGISVIAMLPGVLAYLVIYLSLGYYGFIGV